MERFTQTFHSLSQRSREATEVHPLIVKAQEEAVSSQIADLEGELREYEALKAGEFQLDELSVVADLPDVLIKARIAQGLSQKDLADRMGLKEQQIQRYEATDYASAKSDSDQGGCERLGRWKWQPSSYCGSSLIRVLEFMNLYLVRR